ncbi:MAG TPA: Fe-S cluster assembly protein SufD [Anaerolineales bacterium]|nr:Fe-S cluster assembly protein SufD [Anaerolineales bacterium]
MNERTVRRVVTRGGRGPEVREFAFTRDMLPSQNGAAADFVIAARQAAWAAAERFPLPHTRLEPWRRTDLRSLRVNDFKLPLDGGPADAPPIPESLLAPLVGDEHGGLIALGPDRTEITLNPALAAQGVVFTDYATAEREYPALLEKTLGLSVRPDEGKFAALTAALARDGVLVYVPKGVDVELPLHSVIWSPGTDLAHFSHVLIYVDDGASVTYVHETASPDAEGQALNGAIVEGYVGQNARLTFVELQSLGRHVYNFAHERIRVDRDGSVDWIYGALGTRLTKAFSDLNLEGEGSSGRMSGFYFTDKDQHLDLDTQQNHHAPHTTSDLLFKGALKGESRSVWQGMIYVAPKAQKTDGYQANRNLVLEKTARADSIPGLEILADDVRCTHGATIGKIDPDHMFYLRSRGIPEREAQRLVVEGFFAPIMDRIPFEAVRERLMAAIQSRMIVGE